MWSASVRPPFRCLRFSAHACAGEENGIWAWERFNALFNWMPLAAVIEKRVICMHGTVPPG